MTPTPKANNLKTQQDMTNSRNVQYNMILSVKVQPQFSKFKFIQSQEITFRRYGIEKDQHSLEVKLRSVKPNFAAMLGFESGTICGGS